MNLRKTRAQERTGKYKALKQKIRELMLHNPNIQVPEIVAQTGFSEYQVMRIYSPLRRELFARSSR